MKYITLFFFFLMSYFCFSSQALSYIFCPKERKVCKASEAIEIFSTEPQSDYEEKIVTAHSRKFLFKAIEMASKEEYPLFLIVLT